MKLGTKSHLITAYSTLFTVALGVLVWDFARRSARAPKPGIVQPTEPTASPVLAMR